MSWLSRLLRPQEPPAAGANGEAEQVDVVDAIRKSARTQARLAVWMEEMDAKVEGGFAELRGAIAGIASAATTPASLKWDEILDALDALDEAAHGAPSPELARGLTGVAARLETFLAQAGLERHAAAGGAPDARLFRVVGTEPAEPAGVVLRVVRAAVTRQGQTVREGEIIVSARPT